MLMVLELYWLCSGQMAPEDVRFSLKYSLVYAKELGCRIDYKMRVTSLTRITER